MVFISSNKALSFLGELNEMLQQFRAVWHFRHFIFSAIMGELKGRFIKSKLGAMWFVLHPLAMAAIYALVLSEVLGAKLGGIDNKAGYAIYLLAGVTAWGLFSEIINRCVTIFLEYGETLKKIVFPRICLPIIVLGSALFNHLLLILAVTIVFTLYGHFPSIHWVSIPIGMALIVFFAFGLGIVLGILNVFSRDVGQVVAVFMNLWFWLTPIIYGREMLGPKIQSLVSYNPMTLMVGIYQDAMVFRRWPDFTSLGPIIILAVGAVMFSLFLFRRASPELVDVL